MSTPTKEARVAALKEARLNTLAIIVSAQEQLEGAKAHLKIIEGQLRIMEGLVDPQPVGDSNVSE